MTDRKTTDDRDTHETRDKRRDDKHDPKNRQSELGKRLDAALEETFPSSDPVSVKITK